MSSDQPPRSTRIAEVSLDRHVLIVWAQGPMWSAALRRSIDQREVQIVSVDSWDALKESADGEPGALIAVEPAADWPAPTWRRLQALCQNRAVVAVGDWEIQSCAPELRQLGFLAVIGSLLQIKRLLQLFAGHFRALPPRSDSLEQQIERALPWKESDSV